MSLWKDFFHYRIMLLLMQEIFKINNKEYDTNMT